MSCVDDWDHQVAVIEHVQDPVGVRDLDPEHPLLPDRGLTPGGRGSSAS